MVDLPVGLDRRELETAACTCDLEESIHDQACPVVYIRDLEAKVESLQEDIHYLNGELQSANQRFEKAATRAEEGLPEQQLTFIEERAKAAKRRIGSSIEDENEQAREYMDEIQQAVIAARKRHKEAP